MKRRNIIGRLGKKRALCLLLALVLVLGMVPVVEPGVVQKAHADDFEWEWTDEWGVAQAECRECSATYQVIDCEDEDDAVSKLEEFFCDECGLCSGDYNEECWIRHHCELCGGCVDDADMCDGCMENDLYAHRDCVAEIDDEGVHCPFCKEHFGAGVVECDCEYDMLVKHCTDCSQEQCVECGICLVIDGGNTEALDNGGCEEHFLCVACIQDDPDHCRECWSCATEVCSDCGLCEECTSGWTHCPECGTCFGDNEVDWCEDADENTHCVYCCEENGWLCEECGQCSESLGLEMCDECGLCTECCLLASEDEGCTHGYCIMSSEYEDHLCPGCMTCPDDTECDDCGMCEECQEDYHCDHGLCPDGADWDEHVCEGCGDCFELDELCDWCGLCEGCREHCVHDVCPEDPLVDDDGDHFICAQCGNCYEGLERCLDCGLCKNCCADNTQALGCEHGYCRESNGFRNHWCYEDEQCLEFCSHDESCTHENVSDEWTDGDDVHYRVCLDCGASVDVENHKGGAPTIIKDPDPLKKKDGVASVHCSVCGADMGLISVPYTEIPKDGSPYILTQPKDYTGKVSDVVFDNVIPRYATFTVKAGGDDLSYQWYWYRKGFTTPTIKLEDKQGSDGLYEVSGIEEVRGAKTDTLTVYVDATACYEEYEYYCVVTNAKGGAETRHARMAAKHVFGHYEDNGDGTHGYYCLGDGCTECDAVAKHRYTPWELKQQATQTQQGYKERKCQDCGYSQRIWIPKLEPGHVHTYNHVNYGPTGHWYECSCGVKSPAGMHDHTWDSGKETKKATEKNAGETTYTCTVCSFKKIEKTPAIPHVHEYWMEYTAGKGGANAYQHYTYCKKDTSHRLAGKHQFGEWHFHGYSVIARDCTVCGYQEYQEFEMFEEYSVTVEGGKANPVIAKPGTKVTVTFTESPGKKWNDSPTGSYWKDLYGEDTEYNDFTHITLDQNAHNKTVTFTMPNGYVYLVGRNLSACKHNEGTVQGPENLPTCTTAGQERSTLCAVCGQVLKEGAILPALEHDYPDEPYQIVNNYCTLRYPNMSVYHYPDAKSASWYECRRCGNHKVLNDRPVVHGIREVVLGGSGTETIWTGETYTEEEVEPTCIKAGRTGNVYCKYCNTLIEKGTRIEPTGHDWGAWEVVKPATTRSKGLEQRVCAYDDTHVETRATDYSGPDLRVKPDKKKIHFDFTYGEMPAPQTVQFKSIGRSTAEAVTFVDKLNFGNVTTHQLDGLRMTVGAVPWFMVEFLHDDTEILMVCDVDDVELQEEDRIEIQVTANIRKTKNEYPLTVEGGKVGVYGKDNAKSVLSAKGGEQMTLKADNKESFLRWEIAEDQSGYLQSYFSYYYSQYFMPETEFFMSANPVKIRALNKDTPGVYTITLDPTGGSVSKTTGYTNSRGEIDYLPFPYRSGHFFDGWWTKPAGGDRVDVGAVLTKDTTVYAHWRTSQETKENPFPSVIYTTDSKPVPGGKLTVDIEAMAEKNDTLMEAFLGDEISCQWLKNGVLIAGQSGETLQIPKEWDGERVHPVVCFNGHQIVGEDLFISESAVIPGAFRFDDVRDESKFYFNPVYWAYYAVPQITNGIDATHFGPNRGCTRGQVVTFLWRAAGSPAPTRRTPAAAEGSS